MARVTVEDCLAVVNNRFELVVMASKRARQLAKGAQTAMEGDVSEDKPTVLALREIAARKVDQTLIDEVEQSGLDSVEEPPSATRIFESEALVSDPIDATPLSAFAREWLDRRARVAALPLRRFRGFIDALTARPYSLSALERYQECPFKFFAADILRLEELPEDESSLSPRARGRFHGVEHVAVR